MVDTAVVLAAGRGSRLDLGGHSTSFSKPLIAVHGQSLLARTVANCRMAGIRRIIVVTGFRADLVAAEVARINRGDIETVFNADWQLKNGLSLYACRKVVTGPFALMMADHLFDYSILADLIARPLLPGSVTLAVDHRIDEVFDLEDATKVRLEGGAITDISKQLDTFHAVDCGIFACTTAIFPALAEAMAKTGDCGLSDGMRVLARERRFRAFDIGDRTWQDVDTPPMLAEARRRLALGEERAMPAYRVAIG